MVKYFTNAEGDECIEVPLCKGCIQDLQEYNPYVDSKGNHMPLSRIMVKEVSQQECENTRITQ